MSAAGIATLLENQPHRIDEIEMVLAEGNSTRKAIGIVARKYGIGRRQAYDYVQAALQRWRDESDEETREEKRAHIRETLWEIAQKAKDRKGITVDGEGCVHEYADPDSRAAVNALELLCRLDGLLDQPEAPRGFQPTLADQLATILGIAVVQRAADQLPANVIDAKPDAGHG